MRERGEARLALVTIKLTHTAVRLLDEMADAGIYGGCREEVAARFVDQMLMNYAEEPTLQLAETRPAAGFVVSCQEEDPDA